jgi:hypothetical protein
MSAALTRRLVICVDQSPKVVLKNTGQNARYLRGILLIVDNFQFSSSSAV